MRILRLFRSSTLLLFLLVILVTTLSPKTSPAGAANSQTPTTAEQQDPWNASETIDAATLAKSLEDPKTKNPPAIVCVGFHTLFEGAHIRGASFHGPGSTPQGLADLKEWAKPLPRSANVILYCGCCPLAHCPNVRPAFTALRQMGFTHLRVLILPRDFATDWVQHAYPIEKGK